MRRALGAVCALILAGTLAVALPAVSGAGGTAAPSAKQRCKHKAKKHKAKKGHKRKKRCRKQANGTSPAGDKPGKTEKPAEPGGPPGRLLATELELSATELRLQLSRASVAAGATIVEQYNDGSDPHNLILERQGSVAFSFPTLGPGGTYRQTVNLARGSWTLYCSILNHRDLGMQAPLTVD